METYMRRVSTSFLGEPARHKCAVRLPKFYRNALLCDVIDVSKDQRTSRVGKYHSRDGNPMLNS